MRRTSGTRFSGRMVPPGIHPGAYRAYGAVPAPAERPTGIPAPSGTRPLPDSGSGMTDPGATAGTINPFYVGLAVTLGVFVAMVVFE